MKKYTLLLFTLLLLCGCDGNYRGVVINGKAIDHITNKPVSNAKVNIVCWVYDMEIWASRKVIKDTTTNDQGEFKFLFGKGEAFDIVVKHVQYESLKYSKTLRSNINTENFSLKRK